MKINNKSHHNVGLIHSWIGESVKNIVDECYIMPDTHAGKEVPIGFVCKIEDKIIPEMVGVDIGCLDKETEFLTQNGWKKMSEYEEGDFVLQYEKEEDVASFVKPINYIKKDCDYFYHFKNSKGLDQMLSEEHKVLVWHGHKKRGYKVTDMSVEQIDNLASEKGYYGVKTAFNIRNKGVELSNNEIRMNVMIAADGTIRRANDIENAIELHFSKSRKIERAEEILKMENIKYNKYKNKDKTITFTFKVKKEIDKDLTKFYLANKEQLEIVAEESLLWDGHKGYRSFFSSTNKENADVIQFAFTATNIRAGVSVTIPEKENQNIIYNVTPTRNNVIGYTNKAKKVKSIDGKKYCFTVPSGYFVARRNGKVFITGNCGMSYFTMPKVEIDFKELHEYILKYIPSGFKSHEYSPIRGYGKYDVQIGTLGGGNHFIEICEGKEDYYVIVHSGSRKYGHDICAKYTSLLNKKSKQERQKERQEKVNKIKHDLINRGREHEIGDVIKSMKKELGDKYYLTGDEFKNYMFEMREAQEFAEYNREEMLTRLKIYFKVRSLKREVIHVTHNYIDKHNVLRKGACSAHEGEPVIIPINMKDGCIVGIGKGNEEWCNSAPHGAGRVLSRTQAKAQLSMDDFINDMEGINTFCVDENRLDEAPRSYNSIDTILENIEETIEIVEIIKPIFNFKSK